MQKVKITFLNKATNKEEWTMVRVDPEVMEILKVEIVDEDADAPNDSQ